MSVSIIIVDKSGSVKQTVVKSFAEDELYKKAGFKSASDFQKHYTYNFLRNEKPYTIDLYGKLKGKANQENKYDWPPPMDCELFFGSCVLVNRNPTTLNPINLSEKEWEECYETLFGGFEDLDSDDDDDASEDTQVEEDKKTKEGYIKDDFVVDDEEDEDEEDDEDEDDDDDDEDEDDDDVELVEDDDDNCVEDDDDDDEDEDIDEEEEEDEDGEEEEEEEDEDDYVRAKSKVKKQLKMIKQKAKSKPECTKAKRTKKEKSNTEDYLDCGVELEEEEYV